MSVNFNSGIQPQYQPQQQYTPDYNQQPQVQTQPDATTTQDYTQQMQQPVEPAQTQTAPEQTRYIPNPIDYSNITQPQAQPATMPAVDPQVYIQNQTQYNMPAQTNSQQAIQGYTQQPIEQPQMITEEPVQPAEPKEKKNLWDIIKSDEAALWTGGVVSTAALLIMAFAKRR